MGTYLRRRAACPQGPTYCTYWVRVPATGVPYVPCTVAAQVPGIVFGAIYSAATIKDPEGVKRNPDLWDDLQARMLGARARARVS